MPTLRLLPGGLPQFASPGFVLSGRPSFDVQAGEDYRFTDMLDDRVVGQRAFLEATAYYSSWYKTGVRPTINPATKTAAAMGQKAN